MRPTLNRGFTPTRTAKSLSRLALATGIGAALVLTGCSGGGSTDEAAPSEDGSSSVSTITVGMIPVTEFASVYVAVDQGFFEEEGLDVETQIIQNAASIAPSVINGQLQFGTAASSPFLSAVDQGLPLIGVANGSSVPTDESQDPFAVVVSADSDIEGPLDLAGKTVAVNALGSGSHVTTVAAIEQAGGDHTETTFVAMPFPDMLAALERGNIDAAKVVEPFVIQAVESGARVISSPLTQTLQPEGTYSLFFTSNDFAAENPDIVEKFKRAVDKASRAAAEDRSLVGIALENHANLAPDLFEKMNTPVYTDDLNTDALQHTADLMTQYGFLNQELDVSKAIWQG